MKEIDARGLACPAPVLQTKAALQEESPNDVRVVVDNAASQQNVQRFLESQGFQTALEQTGPDYIVIGSCDSMPSAQPQPRPDSHPLMPIRSWLCAPQTGSALVTMHWA
jgi:TusA-related sulfurtransferase